MSVVYYAAYDGTDPVGLFRLVSDDAEQALTMERLTADGTWQDDPDVISELREPEVQQVGSAEAEQVRTVLTAGPADLGQDEQPDEEQAPPK